MKFLINHPINDIIAEIPPLSNAAPIKIITNQNNTVPILVPIFEC